MVKGGDIYERESKQKICRKEGMRERKTNSKKEREGWGDAISLGRRDSPEDLRCVDVFRKHFAQMQGSGRFGVSNRCQVVTRWDVQDLRV